MNRKNSSQNRRSSNQRPNQRTARPRPTGARPERMARQPVSTRPTPRPTPRPAPNPKAAEKRRRANAIVPMIVFISIVLYLCGQMFDLLVEREQVDIETVQIGTLDTPERYTGLIVRDEFVVSSDRSGQVFYEFSEGDAVSRYAKICTVKDVAETDDLEEKIYEIDQDILEQQKLRADLSIFAEDIARLESNIDRSIAVYESGFMGTDVSYIYDMKDEVSGFMSQRDAIWLSESIDSLASMSAEKTEYEEQLSANLTTYTAPKSGILAFTYDGLEETLSSKTLDAITESQVAGAENDFKSKTQLVEDGDMLYRIVEANKWYVVAYVSNTLAVSWSKGDSKNLYLTLDDSMIDVTGKIESLDIGETQTKVVFSTYERMDDFMDQRVVRFYFESDTISGLKVPNDAIVEKNLLVVPEMCMAESGSERGVLVNDGDAGRFVAMDVITYKDGNYYIETSAALALGTQVLCSEDGIFDSSNIYTISSLESLAGVYLVNSSMAEFVTIEILDQNQEYAIIRSGSTYGLQNFDSIVANAKNIQEGQAVY